MALRGLALSFLLVLAPQLPAWIQKDPGPKNQGGAEEAGKCPKPQWDGRLQFVPSKTSYEENEELTLNCSGDLEPFYTKVKCAREFLGISSGEAVYGDAWWGRNSTGAWTYIERAVECVETCKKPSWDPRLQLAPNRKNYKKNEEVVLSCPKDFQPSFTRLKCLGEDQTITSWNPLYRDLWLGRDGRSDWIHIQSRVECIETCKRPQWDPRLQMVPDQENYKKNEEVMLSCPEDFQPSFTHVKCSSEVQAIRGQKSVYREDWRGRDSRGDWIHIQVNVECIEKCQKPQWDPRSIFDPDRGTFNRNEAVKVRCPEGHWPPPMEIKCAKMNPRPGSLIPRSGWIGKNGTGRWHPVEGNLTCVDVLQVVSESLEISSNSITLNWTCRLPDACEHVRARCRLEAHSSPPCEAEEVKGEKLLQGQEGTFTCPPLQPFTVYSVTISLPPSTVLYTRLLTTKETVPDKPEKLWLDPNTGSLSWKPLASCKGKIIGYQLNITTRRAHDGSFLEFKQVMVNQSVTQYTSPRQTPGSKYMVTVQGLTAAGAGAASVLEFQTYVSVAGRRLGSWTGMVVTVVVLVSLVVALSAGILWFVLSRRRKALPSKPEEEHYTELQPYENVDNYCVVKGTLLAEEDAGKGGQAGEMLPQTLPVLESSGDSESSDGKEKMRLKSLAQC